LNFYCVICTVQEAGIPVHY